MRRYLTNQKVLENCKIYQMLSAQSEKKHLSFHTPGHKVGGWDITELSYSDNLSCPQGCILQAERDIAEILGGFRSFILTDGSTSGVLSMLYAAKRLGVRSVAVCENSHKSVFNGCSLLGLNPLVYPRFERQKIPFPPTMSALKADFGGILANADALFLTSPDYYGNVADLKEVRKYCDETGKLLLIDGAHGGHLHFEKSLYAGTYADMWVDGVHKSLPALTQGGVVSAKNERFAEVLSEAVDIFRTTSPSYPIMASVEYAVKYPRNTGLEKRVLEFCKGNPRVYSNQDFTKLCIRFGNCAFEVQNELEREGIYPEFCDGNVILFYLSPATSDTDFALLTKKLNELFKRFPKFNFEEEKIVQCVPAPCFSQKEWVELSKSAGRICARICGLFPPCTPLLTVGESIAEEKIKLLQNAKNVFGLKNGKISVFIEKEE